MRERTRRIRDSVAHALTHPSLRVLVPAALPAAPVQCTPTNPSASSPSHLPKTQGGLPCSEAFGLPSFAHSVPSAWNDLSPTQSWSVHCSKGRLPELPDVGLQRSLQSSPCPTQIPPPGPRDCALLSTTRSTLHSLLAGLPNTWGASPNPPFPQDLLQGSSVSNLSIAHYCLWDKQQTLSAASGDWPLRPLPAFPEVQLSPLWARWTPQCPLSVLVYPHVALPPSET